MDQEEAITGIRKINISLAEREFKAKPIYAYDVFISEKEYAEMLANEKKVCVIGLCKFGTIFCILQDLPINQLVLH